MSEEEDGAKCCGFAFSAQVVTRAVCMYAHIHIHRVRMDTGASMG